MQEKLDNLILCRKVYVLANWSLYYYKWFVLDVTEQKWETYTIPLEKYLTVFGKLITMRGNLYYFHDLANPNPKDSIGAINRISRNGTMIDLKVDKPFLNEYDIDDDSTFWMNFIQLVPFSRRFFKNDSYNLEYTKFV